MFIYRKNILMQGEKIVLPLSLPFEVVDDSHKSVVGHSGAARIIGVVSQSYVWNDVHAYIEEYCSHCETCITNKTRKTFKEPQQPYTFE